MKQKILWILSASFALLLAGCVPQQRAPQLRAPVVKEPKPVYAPQPPKKEVELKEVEDTNFSSEYMYPETSKKKEKVVETATSTVASNDTPLSPASVSMTKTECIAMIGQVKFDKYTEMFGSEAASLKRCKMLKAI